MSHPTPWLSLNTVLPTLATQQLFHLICWLVLLCWCTVAFLPVQDRRWRWLVSGVFWLLVLGIGSWPLSVLGMAFQTPALMTMCLCLSSAWQQLRSHPSRLFYSARPVPVSQGLWLVVAAAGGLLLLDTFGGLSVSVYALGFDAALAWTGWLCALIWLMLAYWFDLPVWHVQVAGSWLVATGLFVFTRAPSGNVWDAWLDPWLWLLAMTKITTYWWRQRMRSSHS